MSTKTATDTGSGGLPQTHSAFPLARVMSLAPSAQIILAIILARRYYPIISLRDILFCAIFPTYLVFANNLRFKSNLTIRERPKNHPYNISVVMSRFFSAADEAWFQKYMTLAATIGLILPLIAIFYAPREVAVLAAPHLFVLWAQIIGESIVMFNPNVHRFIALLVPLGFSVYRLNLLVEWFLGSVELYKDTIESTPVAYVLGLALASINIVFWFYNLFVALLLKITPEMLNDSHCESSDMRVMLFEEAAK